MAFVDYLHTNHQEQGSANFNTLPTAFHPTDMTHHTIPPPPPSQVATVTLPPPGPPSMYPYTLCPHCHFQQHAPNNYSVNTICPNCSLPLPPLPIGHSLVPPGIQHSASPIPAPLAGEVLSRLNSHHQPPPLSVVVGGQLSRKLPTQIQAESSPAGSNVDRFMMTSIIDAVDDMLNDSDHNTSTHSVTLGANTGANSVCLLKTFNVVQHTENHTVPPHKLAAFPPPSIPLTLERPPGGIYFPPSSSSSSPSPKLMCKCGNDHVAVCMECHEYLCSSCISSHEQLCPSKDSKILIYPPSTSLPRSRKTTPPRSNPLQSPPTEPFVTIEEDEMESCTSHPEEKLAYFCLICSDLECKICVGTDHAHHKCIELREAYSHFRPGIKDILRKTQVELDLLQYSLTDIKKMSTKVSKKQQEAVANVKQIFQAHREAVAARENEVIAQINDIASKRTSSLNSEKEEVMNALESLKSLSQAGEKAVQSGNKSQMLVSHHQLSNELNRCHYYMNSLLSPSEDDSFILKSDSGAAQSSLKSLCTFTTAPYPPHCSAMGEGLFHPRVNRLCTVILATKDRAGEPCVEGGERLFVQLKPLGPGSNGVVSLPIDFRDNFDGSYSINFRPRTKGEHQLVVAIRGQHIKGSPFTLFVDGGREYGRFGNVMHVFGAEGSNNGHFCRPWGICCDQQGNIIIGDRSNHRIQVFEMNGTFKHKFGSEGVRPGQFNRPAGVAITREGHVVVADKDNHRIQVLKIDGSFLFMFGSKGGNDGQMIYPYDVAVNQLDGRIAVTDTGNHRLLIFSHDGILLGKFGYKGYLCGHFDSPRGIAFNDEGHIIVSDFNVHHILVIHPDGTTARILGSQGGGNGQFMRPQGIAIDHMGNFIVADTRNNRIVIMHSSGQFVAKFGMAGSGPGQFDRPTSVAVLPNGHLAVVDFGNSRIQIF